MCPSNFAAALVALIALATVPAQEVAGPERGAIEVSGLIHDEAGRLLRDVAVSWFADAAWTADQLEAAVVARSDAQGRYSCRVPGGDPGMPDLQAAVLRRQQMPVLVFWRRGRATTAFTLTQSRALQVDVCLVPAASLRVRVVDAAGAPVAGIRVRSETARPVLWGFAAAPTTAVRSDDSGIAVLRNVPVAGVEVVVDEPGWARRRSAPVVLGADLTLRTEPTGFLSGRLVRTDGSPVRGIVDGIDRAGLEATVRTDHQGRFALPRASRFPHRLRALDRYGVALALEVAESWRSGPAAEIELVVPVVAPKPLAVTVLDDLSGGPVAGARVTWFSAAAKHFAVVLGHGYRTLGGPSSARTDAEGRALVPPPPVFEDLVSGESVLVVESPSHTWAFHPVPTAVAERDVEVRLQPPAPLRGVVVEDRLGAPLADARVLARPDLAMFLTPPDWRTATWQARTDSAGRFSIQGLAPGTWRLDVQAVGHRPVEWQAVEVAAAGDSVQIEVPAPAVLEGRVQVRAELPGATRILVQPEPGTNDTLEVVAGFARLHDGSVPLDPDGSFRIEGLAAEPHDVSLRLPGSGLGGAPPDVLVGYVGLAEQEERRRVDGRPAVPVLVRGSLQFVGGDVPAGRLALQARQVGERGVGLDFDLLDPSAQALVVPDREGRFTLRLPAGRWQFGVFDLLSGFAFPVGPVREFDQPGASIEFNERVEVGEVRVHLGSRDDYVGSQLRLVHDFEAAPNASTFGDDFGLFENYIALGERGVDHVFFLAPGPYVLRLWGESAALPRSNLQNVLALSRLEPEAQARFGPVPGEVVDVELRLPER